MPWNLARAPDGSTLAIRFEGRLMSAEGVASAEAFAQQLERGRTHVIWDLRRMTGYEMGSRVAWQNALWPLRRNILSIEVIGGNTIVRLGALALSSVLGVPATFSGNDGKR